MERTMIDILDFNANDSDNDKEYAPSSSGSDTNWSGDENEGVLQNAGEILEAPVEKIATRKRQRNPASWKCNKRKALRAAGLEYVSARQKMIPCREIKTFKNCVTKCIYKCSTHISEDERQKIFEKYCELTAHEKRLFVLSTTKQLALERRRKEKTEENSRRKFTYNYYFSLQSSEIQVCKLFYLGTLNISQTPIYTCHATKDKIVNVPNPSKQGKHTKHITPGEDVEIVRKHIKSFPKVESHYCRAKTQRLYLESTLNIKKNV